MTVTATITSDGQALAVDVAILSITVTTEVNRIPTAEIRVRDGSGAQQEFAMSNSTFFEPGREIEILLRHEGDQDRRVFNGVVVSQRVEASRRSSSLIVEVKDPAVALTMIRNSRILRNTSDSDAMTAIVEDAGLSTGQIPSTNVQFEEIVQYYSTDWDFLISRADLNGLLVTTDGGKISMAPIEVGATAIHEFSFGLTPIFDFDLALDGATQTETYNSVGWDPVAQAMTEPTRPSEPAASQGNLSGAKTAKKLGIGPFTLSHPVATPGDELAAWSKSRLARNRMAFIRGRLSVPGQADLALLDVISIDGIGDRFNGRTIITGLVHRLARDGWFTDIQFGLSPQTFSQTVRTDDVAAAGLLPPLGGLQIGVITEFEEDPEGEERARVTVPGIDAAESGLWARVSSFDAGSGRGWFSRPEVGDEVVLGFLNNDPRQPVILGSLHGSANVAPEALVPATEDNHLKGFVTRAGTKLLFDDEKPAVTIETAAGNKLAVDDDAGTITIVDSNDNTITLSSDGIVVSATSDVMIESSGDLGITSGGSLSLRAGGNLTCEADGEVTITGSKVDVK